MPKSTSIWLDTVQDLEPRTSNLEPRTSNLGPRISDLEPLTSDITCDVCVVGAGIAGITTAYLLAREGRSAVVLDTQPVGHGQTGVTTAHLSSEIDDGYVEMLRLHGPDGARLAHDSHRTAIDRIEANCREERIACDFERVNGYLFLGRDDKKKTLHEEAEAARAAGADVTELPDAGVSGFRTGPCLRFANQGQFHPLKYLAGLAGAFQRRGGRVYTGTKAVSATGGSSAVVKTASGNTITAGAIVIATNSPFTNLFTIHTKQAPYHTYAIGMRVPDGAITHALYWDTEDPYHYVRLQRTAAGEVLIVGGEDHKTAQAQDADSRFERLEAWARDRFPSAGNVEFRWSGQVMETVDGLAYIGRNPLDEPNVYIATGDSGMGMTHGTIAGMLITDLIQRRLNPWADLYDPSRKRTGTAIEWMKENLNVALQYKDWLTAGDVESIDQITPNNGAVIVESGRKVAVFRDERGEAHRFSAVCPHMGCIVRWNPSASTWDCPCHGSRFDKLGSVINGPSPKDLEHL